MTQKKSKKKEITTKRTLKNQIHGFFHDNPGQPFNYKQVCKRLQITRVSDKQLASIVLEEMANLNIIEEVSRGKYRLKSLKGYVTGTVEFIANGAALVKTEELDTDVLVSNRNLNSALNGDIVKVYVFATRKKGVLEGEVVEIIKRSTSTFVGVVEINHGYAFLVPDGKRSLQDIFIPPHGLNGVKSGQKAIARVVEWPRKRKNPIGEIIEVLGYPGDNDVEMHAILAEFELPSRFPKNIEEAALEIPDQISDEEIAVRRDFRKVTTFTIDPVDAKDFDDALSIQKTDNGLWEVGVHIADVTHYIKEDSVIDTEGRERGTSVYLVDRVVPMLPEKLSNYICSLRPNEDKLCFSAVFLINEEAKVVDRWFGRTIIHSDRRFNYDEAQQIIETGKGDFASEMLTLHQLAQKLRAARFKTGAIGFDKVEIKFHLDEEGKPTGVYYKISKDSNKLIEEFMLLANREVAEFIGKPKEKGASRKTFVYRIHDKPDQERLLSFSKFIKQFGYSIKVDNAKVIAQSINKLLNDLEGKGERTMIETLAIRAMAKAEYSTHNIGHYGLSFPYYTHFTSPIRRYPDMMVHRMLDHYLLGGHSLNAEHYEKICRHSSERESLAAEAERASIKYKQAEFLSTRLGQVFDGIISGVTQWGLFVELNDSHCEGMIPLRNLENDFYIFDDENHRIYGRYTNIQYRLGDPVTIRVVKVNMGRRQIDFQLAEPEVD